MQNECVGACKTIGEQRKMLEIKPRPKIIEGELDLSAPDTRPHQQDNPNLKTNWTSRSSYSTL
jgi:hypothetical protein